MRFVKKDHKMLTLCACLDDAHFSPHPHNLLSTSLQRTVAVALLDRSAQPPIVLPFLSQIGSGENFVSRGILGRCVCGARGEH